MILCFVLGAAAVAAGPVLGAKPTAMRARLAVAAALVHPLAVVGLFYSLALHMYARLGGWPERIGETGLADALVLHAELAKCAFGALLLGCAVALPSAVLGCALLPGLRNGLRHLGIYGCGAGAAMVLVHLAPAPFLHWWWD